MDCSTPYSSVLHYLLDFFKFLSIEWVILSNQLILCCPLLLLPSIFPSIRVFTKESAVSIRWSKYWGFCFSNSSFSEDSGLISLRIDWFDLLAVQGTLKNLLQRHNLKTSILWYWAFFTVQISYPYMTTGNTIALNIGTFVSKVMLYRFVIAFLPRNKCLYISWLHSLYLVILELNKIKSVTVSTISLSINIYIEVMGKPLDHSGMT